MVVPDDQSADWKAFTRRVGMALAHHRRLKGLSQQQVGEAIGVEPETISRMETGVISPSLKRLCQLSEVLGCPVEHLIGAASNQPQSLLNRLSEQVVDLSDRDRAFVLRQSLALAQWLADRTRHGDGKNGALPHLNGLGQQAQSTDRLRSGPNSHGPDL
jgi:transcriptional regulator with XRE-family HTH domain